MSCIVYQTNKKTGIKYAYESVSYWDKDKNQPRSKRKYLGRVDPETGEIVKKKSGQETATASETALHLQVSELEGELERQRKQAEALQSDLSQLREKYRKARELLYQIKRISGSLETGEG